MIGNYAKLIFSRAMEFYLFGNTRQKKVSEYHFRTQTIKSKEFAPVFFLSTGRTGTEFFTHLLERSNSTKVFHSPSSILCNAQSELIEQGRVAYEAYKEDGIDNETVSRLAAQIVMAGREELLYKTFLHDKIYMETNNRITFLAPAIKSIIPHARFIYLYRHPGEFIRSGIRRNYYSSKGIHELGRLKPTARDRYADRWEAFSPIQKVAWLWNETNGFIEDFFTTLPENDCFSFDFNDLSVDNIDALLSFLNITDIERDDVEQAIAKPVNVQRGGSFPRYEQWSDDDRASVMEICGELCRKYGYV